MRSGLPFVPHRYRILRLLGEGGEGRVFLVQDAQRDGALLALKALSGHRAVSGAVLPGSGIESTAFEESLRQEFEVLSRLAHPALARVWDFGRLGDREGVYFTRDYAPGENLLAWCMRRPFAANWTEFYSLAAQLLGALHAVHSAGYVHGDIKPSHAIVREDSEGGGPRLSLIDLGSARLQGAVNHERRGTPAYRPPHSVQDERDGDLYATGMTLFQAITGRLPFALGDAAALAAWRSAGEPARLGAWIDDAPHAVCEVIEKLTTGALEARFPSAQAAIELLERRSGAGRLFFHGTGVVGRFRGREKELEEVLACIRCPEAPVAVLTGPPGFGKTRLAVEVALRAQLDGARTLHVSPETAVRSIEALNEVASVGDRNLELRRTESSRELSFQCEGLLRAAENQQVLVLLDAVLDDEQSGGKNQSEQTARGFWISFVRAHAARPPAALRLIVTARRGALLRRYLGVAPDRWHEVPLGPLLRGVVRELAVDTFSTSQIPERLIEQIDVFASGSPGRILTALRRLAASSGLRIDPVGHLAAPPNFRLESNGADSSSAFAGDLHRRAMAIVALAPGPLDSAGLASLATASDPGRFRAVGQDTWEAVLEDLYGRGGLLKKDLLSHEYSLASPKTAPEWCRELCTTEARSVLSEVISRLLTAPSGGKPHRDRFLLLARAAARSGDARLALRSSLRSIRDLRAGRRIEEAIDLSEEILRVEGNAPRDARFRWLLALRRAELALIDGRRTVIDAAREWMAETASEAMPVSARALALVRRGQLELASGRTEEATAAMETAVSLIESRKDGSGFSSALLFEASARLASLRFVRGETENGHLLLARGNELADAVLDGGRRSAGAPGRIRKAGLPDNLPLCISALTRFGELNRRHGKPDAALRVLDAGRVLARRIGRPDLEAGPLHETALVHASMGRYDHADEVLKACEAFAQASGDRMSLLRVKVHLATLCQRSGDEARAEKLFHEARLLGADLGDLGAEAASWIGLGLLRRDRGDLLGALRIVRQILRRFHPAHVAIRANALLNLGEIYLALGKPDRARRERARALVLARSCDNRLLAGYALMGLGTVRWAVGDSAGAECRLRSALRLAEPEGNHALLGAIHLSLGLVAKRRGELGGAMRHLGRALLHAGRASSRPQLEQGLMNLLDCLIRTDRRPCAGRILASWAKRHWPNEAVPCDGGRHRFAARAMVIRVRSCPLPSAAEILDLAREAEEAGEILAAMQILAEALQDPCCKAAGSLELLARYRLLAARFIRRSSPRDRRFFESACETLTLALPRDGHPIPTVSTSEPHRANESAVVDLASDPLAHLAQEWARGTHAESATEGDGASPGSQEKEIENALRRLRDAIPVRGVWVLNQPGSREPLFYSSESQAPPFDFYSARYGEIAEVLNTGRTRWGDGDAIVFLSDSAAAAAHARRKALYYRFDRAAGDMGPLRSRMETAAGLLACYFRIRFGELARRSERGRLAKSQEEIRRLHALLIQGKKDIETAVITQRFLLVERQRILEAGGTFSGSFKLPACKSPMMRTLIQRLRKVAGGDLPILLLGEAGVGKDTLARLVHRLSPRKRGAFIGELRAIPESLIESELFGYCRGAFTGAEEDRPGLLQLASGGSLYLDELSDLSPVLQARLLRVFEEGAIRPIGSEKPRPLDLRWISSSRRPMAELETSGAVRRDLLYRLKGEVIEVPPLRERREDIPLLVESMVEQFAREKGVPTPAISPDLVQTLSRRDWPGNIRQLESEVKRAFLMRSEGPLTTNEFLRAGDSFVPSRASLSPTYHAAPSRTASLRDARRQLERALIDRALLDSAGNATLAARALRISRRYLGVLLDRYGIRLKDFLQQRGDL